MSGNIVNLKGEVAIQSRQPNVDVVDLCLDMLEMARSGELQGVCGGLHFADTSVGVIIVGADSLTLLGAVERAKSEMLQHWGSKG